MEFEHFNLDDATKFVNKVGKTIVYAIVYVDELLMEGISENYIGYLKKELKKGFEMIDS